MIKNIEWKVPPHTGFKLERIKKALGRLGNPEAKIPYPVHIAGTNGKGSTTSFIRAILEEAGLKCHVYTSPNLICLNERIVIAGRQIGDAEFLYALGEIRDLLYEENLSFFEGLTALAFCIFAREKADISLIEAGLGGRLDATNVLPGAKLSVITSISFDHTEFLGETIREIASEKFAIINGGRSIIAHQKYEEVYELAPSRGASIYGRDFTVTQNKNGFLYNGRQMPRPALLGAHQIYNAATAIKACEILAESRPEINEAAIKNGLQNAVWPARFQPLKTPFTNLEVYLDGGHNEDGVRVILEELTRNKKPTTLIMGLLSRKKIGEIALHLVQKRAAYREVITTGIHSTEEARAPQQLRYELAEFGVPCTRSFEHFYEALSAIPSGRVVILGSLYLAGEVLEWSL